MKAKILAYGLLLVTLLLSCRAIATEKENVSTEKYLNEEVLVAENTKLDIHANTITLNGRKYNFFSDEVFESIYFSSIICEEDYKFLIENPILRAYFLMIYPISSWLEEESLHILEIL